MNERVIKTLIVDDEPIARTLLREELANFTEISVVGEADNGRKALQMIRELRPDLVFLDLQMPVLSRFEVIRNLEAPRPVIVIITAFDQHAIQAFEAGAVDYLLKPVSEDRLFKAVDRAKSLVGNPAGAANAFANISAVSGSSGPGPNSVPNRRVIGRVGEVYHLLDADEVIAFQADRGSNFVRSDFYVTKWFKISEGMKLRIDGQLFNVFNHPNFALPSILNAGIPGKPATQTGIGAITGTTSPPTGLVSVRTRRRQHTRMVAFQARLEF
jgi:DNA-binding LytR/AlgR family response regulator